MTQLLSQWGRALNGFIGPLQKTSCFRPWIATDCGRGSRDAAEPQASQAPTAPRPSTDTYAPRRNGYSSKRTLKGLVLKHNIHF